MLTPDEVTAYQRNGYVIPREFQLSADMMAPLQTALERVLQDNPKIMPDRMINPHLEAGRQAIRGARAIRVRTTVSRSEYPRYG